jgi:hypothetical protein
MRLVVDVAQDLREELKRAGHNLAAALTNAVDRAASRLVLDLRRQVRGVGLGPGLEKAWRYQAYPPGKRASTRAAALVFSKAPRLHAAFETGAEIEARRAKWLVLPLPAAEALGLDRRPLGRKPEGRANPRTRFSDVEAAVGRYGRLAFVPLDGGRKALLVARGLSRGRRATIRRRLQARGRNAEANRLVRGRVGDVALFLLVRRVRVGKRLDIAGAVARARADLGREVAGALSGID